MSVDGEVARADDHNDRIADVEIAVDAVLVQRDLRHIEAGIRPPLEISAAPPSTVNWCCSAKTGIKAGSFVINVAGQVDRDHGQVRRGPQRQGPMMLSLFPGSPPALVPTAAGGTVSRKDH